MKSNLPLEDHVITKNGCQTLPLEFSRRIQKSNWFCSSTLGKCPNQQSILRVLKLQFLRKRGQCEWCQHPGKCFFSFKYIQRHSKNGGAFETCKGWWGTIKPLGRASWNKNVPGQNGHFCSLSVISNSTKGLWAMQNQKCLGFQKEDRRGYVGAKI